MWVRMISSARAALCSRMAARSATCSAWDWPGFPVVTTDASALPEVVDHGANGFLCPRDDVAAFAERVLALGEDAALRRRFGEHGRAKVVRSFGYDQLAGGLIGVYERLLGDR